MSAVCCWVVLGQQQLVIGVPAVLRKSRRVQPTGKATELAQAASSLCTIHICTHVLASTIAKVQRDHCGAGPALLTISLLRKPDSCCNCAILYTLAGAFAEYGEITESPGSASRCSKPRCAFLTPTALVFVFFFSTCRRLC